MRTKQQKLIVIGERIRRMRERLGFSQEAFAAHVGISRSHYGCIERGEFTISLNKLLDIAIGLNIEISELLPTIAELQQVND